MIPRLKKVSLFAIAISVAFFGFFCHASATTLEARPSALTRTVGETFTITLYVGASESPINAVSGAIVFPQDTLDFVSLSHQGSIVSIWPEEPVYKDLSGTGSVNFEGVILGGFSGKEGKIASVVLRAKKPGVAEVKITDASVLANDGKGTNLLVSLLPSTVTIKEKVPEIVGPKIASSTHPDQTAWYAKNKAVFSWNVPKGTAYVAYAFDKSPETVPAEGGVDTASFSTDTITDGIWYMHVRFKDAKGAFGPVSHYKIQIDTVRPENVTVQEIEAASADEAGTKNFALDAFDALSGIVRYQISVDDTLVDTVPATGRILHSIKGLRPGSRNLKVVAYDAAGNFIATERGISVAGFSAPIIEYVEDKIPPASPLVVSGHTAPNATVRFYMVPRRKAASFESTVDFSRNEATENNLMGSTVSDDTGIFHFVSSERISHGSYEMFVVAVKSSGIQSDSSRTIVVRARYLYSWKAVLLGSISLVFLLGCALAWLYFRTRKQHGHLKDTIAVKEVNGAIDMLTRDLQEKARELDEKIKTGKHLGAEEKELLSVLLEQSVKK